MEKKISECVETIVSQVAKVMNEGKLPVDFAQAKEISKTLELVAGIRGREGGMAPTVKGAKFVGAKDVEAYLVKLNAEKVATFRAMQFQLKTEVDALSVAVQTLGNIPAAKSLAAQLAAKSEELSGIDKHIASLS